MLGASPRQLLRSIYPPSAMSWVFASLHNAVGWPSSGAVVGEYLGSARGVGYLILQAEGTFDINTVFAGILVLTAFALVLDALVGRAERRLMTWQPRAGETEKICAAGYRPVKRAARFLGEVGDALLEVGGLERQFHLVVRLGGGFGQGLEFRFPRLCRFITATERGDTVSAINRA